MEEYLIHKFSEKLLQRSAFPRLKEYILWRRGEKADDDNFGPVSVNLDLTSACTNRCPHCIDKSVLNTGKFLDLQYIKNLLKDWKKRGLKSVIVIGGGEPTLHPNFEEIIKFIKGLSLPVGIVSNGTQIEKIKSVSRLLGKRDWVRLSLDAGTNETFQQIHRPKIRATLEEILSAVRAMRRKHLDFQIGFSFLIIGEGKMVNHIPLVNNIKEISLAAQSAKECGFSYFSLKPFISPEGSRPTEITAKNLKEIREEIKKAKRIEDKDFKIIESINLLCFYDKNLKEKMRQQPKTCHMQFFRQVINPQGVFSCSSWRGFNNLKIVNSNQKITGDYFKKFQEGRKKIINNFNAKDVCRDIHCYYAPFNYWVEELINSPEKLKGLKPIADFNDYFL